MAGEGVDGRMMMADGELEDQEHVIRGGKIPIRWCIGHE